jgi:hypothetical protein
MVRAFFTSFITVVVIFEVVARLVILELVGLFWAVGFCYH